VKQIRVVLFDLGGVLVELGGVQTMLEWLGNRVSPEELWKMWLRSPAVRAFETGITDAGSFADDLIAEMGLPVAREKLLEAFTLWPRGLFPGALELVKQIPSRYLRATLSNSNAVHWPRLMGELQLAEAFDQHFASHLIGKIKPDDEAFCHVTHSLQCAAEEILFLDDNKLNVEAAAGVGMKAVQVQGVAAAERALRDAGVIENISRLQ
jgi:FMN phosphatase YigB (HAD superfamily)